MNDELREKLSAYLDGALPEAERRALETQIAGSDELRYELEALRAVSATVKGLGREPLPPGFMARLEARRYREGAKPARDYYILPPAYRPLAFALSTAVVALLIWDRTITRPDAVAQRVGWDGEKVALKSAAEAPPSVDVSGRLSALDASPNLAEDEAAGNADKAAENELTARGNKKEDSAAPAAPATLGKHLSAPGKPLEHDESAPSASVASAGGGGAMAGAMKAAAPAPAAPAAPAAAAADALEPAEGGNGAYVARSEEERSAINERLYKGFEEEKKRMGIARIMDKDAEAQNLPSGGREMMALQASPESPSLDRGRSVASVRGAAKAKRAAAPVFKAIALKSPEGLEAAWAAAGLSGEPPAVKFPEEMAVFLAGPSGCGIVGVQERRKLIVVLYKESGFDANASRARAVPASAKPVVVKLVP